MEQGKGRIVVVDSQNQLLTKASLSDEGPDGLVHDCRRVDFYSLHEGGWQCLSELQMHAQLDPAIIQTNPADKLTPMRNDGCAKIFMRAMLE